MNEYEEYMLASPMTDGEEIRFFFDGMENEEEEKNYA